jgi:RNA polymerase sigma factor (sigma-70 family)
VLDTYHRLRGEGKSVAKMSADFNNREQGLNATIEKDMIGALDPVFGDPAYTTRYFSLRHDTKSVMIGLNLADWCYSEMLKVQNSTEEIERLQEGIADIEDTLLRSMLMAAHEIALRSSSNILSIDAMDAAQEVCLYFLESIRKYDPDYRTAQDKRVKLLTYAYTRASNLIQEWIINNSRLVRVPRSKMERILMIVEAYDTLVPCGVDLVALTNEANNVLSTRKGEVTEANKFDIKEVDGLIKILMSNYVHLDQPYGGSRFHSSVTIGEMLSDDEPSAADNLEDRDDTKQLIEILQSRLTTVEYQIIMLRYFHDPMDKVPKALTDVGELLVSVYDGKNYSRESIRKIEKSALDKLKDVKEVQALWLR